MIIDQNQLRDLIALRALTRLNFYYDNREKRPNFPTQSIPYGIRAARKRFK